MDLLSDRSSLIEAFYSYAKKRQKDDLNALILDENLNEKSARRYIRMSLKNKYATQNGNGLNDILPKISPLNPEYLSKKNKVFEKISKFVDKYKNINYKI